MYHYKFEVRRAIAGDDRESRDVETVGLFKKRGDVDIFLNAVRGKDIFEYWVLKLPKGYVPPEF